MAKHMLGIMGKMRILRIVAIGILCPFIAWANALAQSPPFALQPAFPPGVEMHVKATPEIATIGDPIRIDLEITAPSGYRIEIPKPASHIGDFTILDFSSGRAAAIGKSEKRIAASSTQPQTSQHYRAHLLAALYKTGTFTFPALLIKLTAADGKEIALSSTAVTIEIRSVLSDKNQELKDLKKQADLPERRGWIIWLVIAAVLIAGAIIWILLRRKRRRATPLSPEQVRNLMDLAEADLRALLARGFPDSGGEKPFYVLLSEIARRILEAGYEIHTAERTTAEIVSSLNGKPEIESAAAGLIESFLFRCDAVKFARYIPSPTEHDAAAHDALQILAEARKAVLSRQPVVDSEGTG
jgi:hypothetical protein